MTRLQGNMDKVMADKEKMSEKEFVQMIKLLKKYSETEMDQFELWKFDTNFSKVYVTISMALSSDEAESGYVDLSHLLV